MLEICTVAFFGHRYIDNPNKVEEILEEHIKRFIDENECIDFLVGCNGEFDQCAASAITRIRKNYRDDNSSIILVLPYINAKYRDNKKCFESYYGEIEISHIAAISHPKAAIKIRNCEMVDRADVIICYVEHKKGGAWQTVKYAISKDKRVINLADIDGY